MLERVGQRLLDYPVGGEVDRGREPRAITVDLQVNGHPGGAHALGKGRQLGDPGLGREAVVAAVVLSQDPEQAPHLD